MRIQAQKELESILNGFDTVLAKKGTSLEALGKDDSNANKVAKGIFLHFEPSKSGTKLPNKVFAKEDFSGFGGFFRLIATTIVRWITGAKTRDQFRFSDAVTEIIEITSAQDFSALPEDTLNKIKGLQALLNQWTTQTKTQDKLGFQLSCLDWKTNPDKFEATPDFFFQLIDQSKQAEKDSKILKGVTLSAPQTVAEVFADVINKRDSSHFSKLQSLNVVDENGETVLHHLCKGVKDQASYEQYKTLIDAAIQYPETFFQGNIEYVTPLSLIAKDVRLRFIQDLSLQAKTDPIIQKFAELRDAFPNEDHYDLLVAANIIQSHFSATSGQDMLAIDFVALLNRVDLLVTTQEKAQLFCRILQKEAEKKPLWKKTLTDIVDFYGQIFETGKGEKHALTPCEAMHYAILTLQVIPAVVEKTKESLIENNQKIAQAQAMAQEASEEVGSISAPELGYQSFFQKTGKKVTQIDLQTTHGIGEGSYKVVTTGLRVQLVFENNVYKPQFKLSAYQELRQLNEKTDKLIIEFIKTISTPIGDEKPPESILKTFLITPIFTRDAKKRGFFTELCNGGDLGQLVKDGQLEQPKNVNELLERLYWGYQLFNGLDWIHRKGYVHLDIKPGNIFLKIDEKGNRQIRLADWDMVASLDKSDESIIAKFSAYGTPDFCSYKTLARDRDQPVTKADLIGADCHAANVSFYEAFTGKKPNYFNGDTWKLVTENLPINVPGNVQLTEIETAIDALHKDLVEAAKPKEAQKAQIFDTVMQNTYNLMASFFDTDKDPPPARAVRDFFAEQIRGILKSGEKIDDNLFSLLKPILQKKA